MAELAVPGVVGRLERRGLDEAGIDHDRAQPVLDPVGGDCRRRRDLIEDRRLGLELRGGLVAERQAAAPRQRGEGEGKEENAIVTSTGQYVVAWDFAKVKKGQLDKYEIKKCVLCALWRRA